MLRAPIVNHESSLNITITGRNSDSILGLQEIKDRKGLDRNLGIS